MNGFTDKEIIGGLLSLLVLSYAAIFAFIFKSIRELRDETSKSIRELRDETSKSIRELGDETSKSIRELHDETSALRRDMQLEFTRVHEQLTGLAVGIARLEGSLWGRAPAEPRKAEG